MIDYLQVGYLDNRKQGQFDDAYLARDKVTNEIVVLKIEAKGGINPSGNYGTAIVGTENGVTVSAEQGSVRYRQHIDQQHQEKAAEYRDNFAHLTSKQQAHVEEMEYMHDLSLTHRNVYIGVEQKLDATTGMPASTKLKVFE